MHHHACGFVDDSEIFVFVNDGERDIFGQSVKWLGLRIAFDLDMLTALELVLCLDGNAVELYLARFDE